MNKASFKQLAKEMRNGGNVWIVVRTLHKVTELIDITRINGYVSVLIGQVSRDDNGEAVIRQTTEICTLNEAERLLSAFCFSSEIVERVSSLDD